MTFDPINQNSALQQKGAAPPPGQRPSLPRDLPLYLQSGQHPVAAARVAAAAVVASRANIAAVSVSSFVFITIVLSMRQRSIRYTMKRVEAHPDLKVKRGAALTFKSNGRCWMGRMPGLLIGELARQAGVSAPTIRYYEEIGLLPRPVRTASGYRRYANSAIEELRFIRKAQTLGFSLDEIAEILQLSRSGRTPCSHVLSLAREHLAALDQRIGQLQRLRDHLASGLAKWTAENTAVTCRGLCQWIAGTESDAAADVPISLKPTRAGARSNARS